MREPPRGRGVGHLAHAPVARLEVGPQTMRAVALAQTLARVEGGECARTALSGGVSSRFAPTLYPLGLLGIPCSSSSGLNTAAYMGARWRWRWRAWT